jgi:aminomuconate-semialdehyde/2-hydroxymuconate-6-semialdehyde dehydrogenase
MCGLFEKLALKQASIYNGKVKQITNFIEGSFQPSLSGRTMDVFNPADGHVYAQVSASNQQDVDLAVNAAMNALPHWTQTNMRTRSEMLHAIANEIEKRLDEFACAESKDNGKPQWLAKQMDIARAIENFRFFANHILSKPTDAYPRQDQVEHQVIRQPVGVCGLITPWNLPIYLLTWKVAPALAMGNVVVCKPSEITPMTANLLAEVTQAVGLKPGVFNIVHGDGPNVGAALIDHPDVALISFTGGSSTGKKIAQSAAASMKKTSLELGGKNPLIVHGDAPLDETIDTVIRAAFLNQGEICLCAERVLVHASIIDAFTEKLVQKTKKLVVGHPSHEDSFMGPLVSKEHLQKVQGCIQAWLSAGATLLTGDENIEVCTQNPEGYYLRPTILSNVPTEHPLHHEEIFGPVITLESFDDPMEAVDRVNRCPYGLCSSIFTQDKNLAIKMAQALETATVWINTWLLRDLRVPFGGMKASGMGREGGDHSLDFYSETKTICIKPIL